MRYILVQLCNILENGYLSLKTDIDGNKLPSIQIKILFIIVPYCIIGVSYWLEINLSNSIDTILTTLSIFTALIFGILFIVPEIFSKRIDALSQKKDDINKNYLIRFHNFTKKFVQQTSFIIVLSILNIVLLLIQKIISNELGLLILSAINCSLFYILLMFILIILVNIYILLMDDVNINKDKI